MDALINGTVINTDNNKGFEVIKEISKLIKETQFEGRVFAVGGFVRDLLLGRASKDVDLVIEMPNGGVEFATWICKKTSCYNFESNPVIFPKFGTAKFNLRSISKIADIDIECVQTRKEKYDNTESRKPTTEYGTIKEDAFRRDLTINALYLNISSGELLDPTGMGGTDIQNHIIRTPSDPNVIFNEDPLRMIRAIRFATRFGWGIEHKTWIGIVTNYHRIGIVSQERITDELDKILLTTKPSDGLWRLYHSGLLKEIMPELYPMIGLKQGIQHFGDVFEHTLAVVDNIKPLRLQRWAALVHDIGKISTYSEYQGVPHFYSHEHTGVLEGGKMLKRMKLPNKDILAIIRATKLHMNFKQSKDNCPSNKSIRKFLSEAKEYSDLCLDVIEADNISHSKAFCAPNQVKLIRDKIKSLSEAENCSNKLTLPIDGKDIMEKFNLKQSPKIGRLLDIIKELYMDDPRITKEQCFSVIAKELGVVA